MFWFLAVSSERLFNKQCLCWNYDENEFFVLNRFCKRKIIKQQNGVQKSNFNQNNSFRKGNKHFHLTEGQNPFIILPEMFLQPQALVWDPKASTRHVIKYMTPWLQHYHKGFVIGLQDQIYQGYKFRFLFYHLIFEMCSWVLESVYEGRNQMLACLRPEILCT